MHWLGSLSRYLLPSMLGVILCGLCAAGDPTVPPEPMYDSALQRAQKEVPVPTQPPIPTQPDIPITAPAPSPVAADLFGPPGGAPSPEPGFGRSELPSVVSGSLVPGGSSPFVLDATDAGSLLGKSPAALGVQTIKRQPIVTETRIRGYNLGQTLTWADGQFFFPARLDLDTFLSKIDSGIVRDIVILKGPYSARYGPGFAFIDIATNPTPRYDCFALEGRTVFEYSGNGRQIYGRQGVWGGSRDWGFRIAYGQRTGNDYRTGDDVMIPASYNARDVDFAYGLDFGPNSSLEFGYIRLDQTDVEFPGQIFDTEFLKTDAFRFRYNLENSFADRVTLDGWFNRTVLEGNAQNPGKRRQIPQLNDIDFIGFTDIDLSTAGYRLASTWGQPDQPQLTVGIDTRFIWGSLNEFDTIALDIPCDQFNFPVPKSHQGLFAGLFVEHSRPLSDRLTLRLGLRGDVGATNVDGVPPGFCPDGSDFRERAQDLFHTTDLDRSYGLFLGYATADYKVNDNWTFQSGLGTAQRPPTLTELYAMEPFLAILQQGFTSVRGNPELNPERLYQMDLGVRGRFERARVGLAGFYSFINDYITYDPIGGPKVGIVDFPRFQRALTVKFVNTDLATLWGGEAYAEYDLTSWMTPFAVMSYVSGRDLSVDGRQDFDLDGGRVTFANNQPLAGFPPLEARIGIRFHEAAQNPRYGLEVVARVVGQQDQVAVGLGEKPSAGFTIYNWRSYWRVRQGMLVTAGMENVFDHNYREHLDLRTGLGVFQPGRNTYVGMELRY